MNLRSAELRMSSWTLDPFLHPLCWSGCLVWMRGVWSDGRRMRWPSKCSASPSRGQFFGWTLVITVFIQLSISPGLCGFSFLMITSLLFVIVYVCGRPPPVVRGQRTACGSQSSLPYGLCIEIRSSDLGTRSFTQWAISPASFCGSCGDVTSIVSSDLPIAARADRTGILPNERNLSQGMFWWLSQSPNPVDNRVKLRPRFPSSHSASLLEDLITLL